MAAIDNLQFDEGSHQYTYEGKPIPSVTLIIHGVLGCNFQAGDWYLHRGKAVHACAAFIGQGVVFSYDPQIEGQVTALRRFYADLKPEVLSVEQIMYSKMYRFAGTPDLICKINNKKAVVDFKASLDLGRTALQLGAYSILEAGGKAKTINTGYGVEIRQDGTYKMSEPINLRNARREFLALRTVHAIMTRLNILPKKERNEQ